jgi:SAM-dependent methyltransferase
VAALGTHCAPATVVGLDLSSAAVAFCRRVNTDPAAHFVCGDAEHLPFPDGTFGAVVNIESSHSYPDLAAFYRQVYRILQPGGSFLYADTVPADSVDVRRDMARTTGFSICDERDITANVLRSCDEQAGVHAQAFVADNDRAVLGDFLAVPGSQNYLNLQSGRVRYLIWRWDRP